MLSQKHLQITTAHTYHPQRMPELPLEIEMWTKHLIRKTLHFNIDKRHHQYIIHKHGILKPIKIIVQQLCCRLNFVLHIALLCKIYCL